MKECRFEIFRLEPHPRGEPMKIPIFLRTFTAENDEVVFDKLCDIFSSKKPPKE